MLVKTGFFYRTSQNDEIHGIDILNVNTGYAVGTNINTNTGVISKTTNGGYVFGIEPITNEMPKEYKLFQNFPNPFNSATQIRFNIPKLIKMNIYVFDILGNLIEELADSILDAGQYYINWNSENLASGIYFYKFISGEFSETRKMVIIK